MSKDNKRVKEKLIRLYGPECFIEKLHLRKDDSLRKYKGSKQYKRMKKLTYHHIIEKSKGGKTNIKNGALLTVENHEWFNRQSRENQRKMNQAFQEYKRSFRMSMAEVTTEGIKEVKMLELPDIGEEFIEIPLQPMTKEELRQYEEHKRKRNKRVFEKMGYEYGL